ncbi:MAG: CAP domain-containing protein [Chloroflexi bacterium]|nr:CAP domain-containing protein [Chloroflexota bacterium]
MLRHALVGLAALLVLALAPPGQPARAADAAADAVALVNAWRARAGIAPLTLHPALQRAAQSHADYYRLNRDDPALAGMGLHQQQPGRPGFTGVEPEDRAVAAGYPARSVNENVGLTGDLLASLRWHIGTINHRLPLLDPRYGDIGVGVVNEVGARFDVILVGTPRWATTASPAWVAWPVDGATDAGLSYSGESPNPFPGQRYPVGHPVTLAYFGAGALSLEVATLTTAGGESVPIIARQGTGWHSRRAFLIAATAPLAGGTTYMVSVRGVADGAALTRQWSFTTVGAGPPRPTATPPPAAPTRETRGRGAVRPPPGITAAAPAVRDLWLRSDGRAAATADTIWLWGPDVFVQRRERYADAPGGERAVYYFDKSRMEITDPAASADSVWYVTTGLLVQEMVTGQVQTGHRAWEGRPPAGVSVAGDGGSGLTPTYADFGALASRSPAEGRAEPRIGQPLTTTLAPGGAVGIDERLGRLARVGAYSEPLGHNIAGVFWDWMRRLEPRWEYVLGYPLTEPYWVRAKVDGVEQDVLVQLFERRAVTYTPANAAKWQVEMGNVGRHYHAWRYGRE